MLTSKRYSMFEPGYIDTHAHMGAEQFQQDRDGVLQRARESNIEHIINIHDPLDDSMSLSSSLLNNPFISNTIGIHPHYATAYTEETSLMLESLIQKLSPVAIGETGLGF